MQEVKLNSNVFLSSKWPLNNKKATIFFIHGAGQIFKFWEIQITGLSKKNNIIAINLPGRNNIELTEQTNINNLSIFIYNFIKRIDPLYIVICGLSMGGVPTQYLLLKKPEIFNLSIIINSGAKLKVSDNIIKLVKKRYTEYLNEFIKLGLSKRNFKFKKLKNLSNSLVNNKEITLIDFFSCNNFDLTDNIKYIKTQTLILTSKEDLLTPEKYGIYLYSNINKSKHINIKNSGHMSPIESAKKITDLINKFIKLNV